MALALRYMVTDKRGGFESIRKDEDDKRIPIRDQRVDPANFTGTITFKLVKEDGLPADWEEIELSFTDLATWAIFRHGEIRTITISNPEPATS